MQQVDERLKQLTNFLLFLQGNGYDLNGITVFCTVNTEYVEQLNNEAINKLAGYFKCPMVVKELLHSHVSDRGFVDYVMFAGFISSHETEHKVDPTTLTWDEGDMFLSGDKNIKLHKDVYDSFVKRADQSYFCKKGILVDYYTLNKLLTGFVVNFGTRFLHQFYI